MNAESHLIVRKYNPGDESQEVVVYEGLPLTENDLPEKLGMDEENAKQQNYQVSKIVTRGNKLVIGQTQCSYDNLTRPSFGVLEAIEILLSPNTKKRLTELLS